MSGGKVFDQQSNRILIVCPFDADRARRKALLEQQGFQVLCQSELPPAQSLAMSERLRLVILGHGFDSHETREMIHWIRYKGTPVLFVYDGPRPRLTADAFLPNAHDAEQLLRLVNWLVWQ